MYENNFKLKVEFLKWQVNWILEIKAYSILRKDEKIFKNIEHKYFQELSEILSNREQKYYVPYKRNYGKDYDIETNSILNLENIKLAFEDYIKDLIIIWYASYENRNW